MTKKDLRLTIDEFTLKKAKEIIPNLSQFVEMAFNKVIETKDTEQYQIQNQIRLLQEENERNTNQIIILQMNMKDFTKEDPNKTEKDIIWRKLSVPYLREGMYDEKIYKEALEVLSISDEELEEILVSCEECNDITMVQEWEQALKHYKKE